MASLGASGHPVFESEIPAPGRQADAPALGAFHREQCCLNPVYSGAYSGD